MDPKDFLLKLEEQSIPFGERLVNAVGSFFHLLIAAPICIVLAPITFFRILFTTRRVVLVPMDVKRKSVDDLEDPDMPDWKKHHKEMYGEED